MKTTDQLQDLSKLDLNWTLLDNANILVAGASGLIGSAFVKTLILNDNIKCNVWALGRDLKKLQSSFKGFDMCNLFFVEGDVTKVLNLNQKFDYIVDCASNASPKCFSEYPVETILGNIYGVKNLIEIARKNPNSRFLYISSGEIYGEGCQGSFKEYDSGYVDCLSPRACYPASKRAAENLCIAYANEYDVDVVIARPCHIYGPGFRKTDDRAYADFFRNAYRKEDIILKSSGMISRSWCYILDCISALLYILIKGKRGEAYNISDSPFTIREFAKHIADIADVNLSIEMKDVTLPPIISKGVLDSTKLRKLGWKPLASLDDNIKSTLEELTLRQL